MLQKILYGTILLYSSGLMSLHIFDIYYRNSYPSVALITTFSPILFVPLLGFTLLLLYLARSKWAAAGLIGMIVALFLLIHPVIPSAMGDLPQQSADDVHFTTMTFNLGLNITPIEELIQSIEEADADIVALQEVSSSEEIKISRALSTQYPYQSFNPAVTTSGLLSKYPIEHSKWHYPPSSRALLEAQILVNDRSVNLYVVHFLPPDIPTLEHQPIPIGIREDHLMIEADFLLNQANNEHSTIIMGDFNMSERSTAYQSIHQEFRDAFREAGLGLGLTFPNDISVGPIPIVTPLIRIDYTFFSGEIDVIQSKVACFEQRSDHCALRSTFLLY